jgi:hypothetical protein
VPISLDRFLGGTPLLAVILIVSEQLFLVSTDITSFSVAKARLELIRK